MQVRRVGFALLPKKVDRVVTPELSALAAAHGLAVVQLDPDASLAECGELHAIVHKLPANQQWEAELTSYAATNPGCHIVDPPEAIKPVRNRETQLVALAEHDLYLQAPSGTAVSTFSSCHVRAPLQATVQPGTSTAAATQKLQEAGMSLPVALKSMAPDGHPAAHQVAVLRTERQLAAAVAVLEHPAVLQEFIPHLPAVFKVYVLGPHFQLEVRHTLPQAAVASSPAAAPAPGPAADNAAGTAPVATRLATAQALSTDEATALLHSLQRSLGGCGGASAAAPGGAADTSASTSAGTGTRRSAATQGPLTRAPGAEVPAACSSTAAGPIPAALAGAYGGCTIADASSTGPQPPHGVGQPAQGTTGRDPPVRALGAAVGVGQCSQAVDDAGKPLSTPASTALGAEGTLQAAAEMLLPRWVLHGVAQHLRSALGLNLFNFDLLLPLGQPREAAGRLELCVVDINYFPGYDKIPGWQAMMVSFLDGLLAGREAE